MLDSLYELSGNVQTLHQDPSNFTDNMNNTDSDLLVVNFSSSPGKRHCSIILSIEDYNMSRFYEDPLDKHERIIVAPSQAAFYFPILDSSLILHSVTTMFLR